ncbi:MAG: hypothetical protein OXH52_05985 [Gammaproteobacteria bacterium]|nr:hypothetical protein [Gammaproteobacteria bacterium]
MSATRVEWAGAISRELPQVARSDATEETDQSATRHCVRNTTRQRKDRSCDQQDQETAEGLRREAGCDATNARTR